MSEADGLICAYILDADGGGQELGWQDVNAWTPDMGLLWVHLDRTGDGARVWLLEQSGIDPIHAQALLQEGARPRVLPSGDDLLVVLRGVNLNPGSDPEDMVGVSMWLEGNRIVTVRHRRLMAVNDLREAVAAGRGFRTTGEFLSEISNRLITRIGPIVEELDDEVDQLEEEILTTHSTELRTRIGAVRRQAIKLRRFLAPQRDVIVRLCVEPTSWLDDRSRARIREVSDRTLRYVEDLEASRERAAVVQEELHNRLSDQMNKTMYLLTLVAAILLPPSFITGLFGINVGGMPGVESGFGFAIVVLAIVVLATVEIILLKRLKWI